jgi:hypothetical protein
VGDCEGELGADFGSLVPPSVEKPFYTVGNCGGTKGGASFEGKSIAQDMAGGPHFKRSAECF